MSVLPPSEPHDETYVENRGNLREQPACERCARLESHIRDLEAQMQPLADTIAGLEAKLRSAARIETRLRRELAEHYEEDPKAKVIREILEHWKQATGHPKAKIPLDDDRAAHVRRALRWKHTPAQLMEAIDGIAAFPYVHPDSKLRVAEPPNPDDRRAHRYDDVEHAMSTVRRIERARELAQRAKQPAPPRRQARDVGGPPAIDRILERLEGVKPERPGQWTARCPVAHNHKREDRNASLSVGMGHKGVVVHCHTGCQPDEIAAALGVPESEWFDEQPTPIAQRPAPRPVDPLPSAAQLEAWQGALANSPRLLERLREVKGWTPGVLAALGVGWDGERLVFPIRNPDGKLATVTRYLPNGKPKMLGLRGRDRGLFPAPETLAPGEVWVVEGEPDAITGHMLGLPCVGVPGANGWREPWAERFRGRPVTVCADCDQPGRDLAKRIAAALDGITTVAIVDLAPERSDGFDLTDFVRSGGTVAQLRELAAAVRQAQMRLAA